MANIGYRTFDGVDDLVELNLGNLASSATVPGTWIFAGRILSGASDAEIIHAPGFDPIDWYIASGGGAKYQFYNGAVDATDGPAVSTTVDVIVAIRQVSGGVARWSIATNSGAGWSSFTHTNSAATFTNRNFPGSGVLSVAGVPYLNARYALIGHCSTSLSDGDIATLTTDLAAWTALSTLTNLWRFDQTPVVDLEGTATQSTITGTTVTANGFPLDEGASGVTGTAAATLDAFTGAASGTATPPTTPYVVEGVAAAVTATRSPSVTFTTPAATGDVVVMFPASTGVTVSVAAPAGWTNVLGGTTDVESDSHELGGLLHVVTSGEAGTTTWTATNWFGANQTGEVVAALVRNVDTATPLNIAASTFSSTNTVTPHVLAGLTPTTTDGIILSAVAKDATGAYSTAPSGWTFVATDNTNQGIALLQRTALSVASSAVSATNITPSAGDEYASITVVLAKLTAVTGSSAVTLDPFTSSAAGTVDVTGTSATTLAAFTSSAVGTFGTDTYVLEDDFSGSSIDTEKWTPYNRIGDLVNSEVNGVFPDNVQVSSGTLKIHSRFETRVIGDSETSPQTVNYTSGQVAQAKAPFTYGDIRVRAKIPGGIGLWPCIWMLGFEWHPSQAATANIPGSIWPDDGWCEIDIAEFAHGHRTQVNCALHYQDANVGGSGEKALGFDASTQFAVYRLVWTPTSLTWMVDPEDGGGWDTLHTITGTAGTDIPDVPMYLIIHTAIGGIFGDTPDSSTFPQAMEVDYARVIVTGDTTVNGAGGSVYTPLDAFTSTASGTADSPTVTGTSATTLDDFASTAAGTHSIAGTSAQTLDPFTSTAAGTHAITGTSTTTLDAFTSTATGTAFESITGTSATTLDDFTSSAAGTANPPGVAGSAAVALDDFTSVATGSHTPPSVDGTAAVTLDDFTATADGSHIPPVDGTVAYTLDAFTSTAVGDHAITGVAITALDAFVAAATGTHYPLVTGTVAVVLDPFTSQAYDTINVITITGRLTITRADQRRTLERADPRRTLEAIR